LLIIMVTRIVPSPSSEAEGVGCFKALAKESTKLRDRAVWNESKVQEWPGVRRSDPTASCGTVFSILGKKNAERRVPEPHKEYKAWLYLLEMIFELLPAWPRMKCFRKFLAPRLL